MKYLIDTAEQSEIDKWKNQVDGVTSNPSLLKKASTNTIDFHNKNIENFTDVFIQVQTVEETALYSDETIFKVPLLITEDFNGFGLLQSLVRMGKRTCATITYDLFQFDYACEVGAEYSIVLCAKNKNSRFLIECVDLKEERKYKTKIIAASFRSLDDVNDAVRFGADYATVPPKYMGGIFSNYEAVEDYNDFYGIE
jgi:transaldolase